MLKAGEDYVPTNNYNKNDVRLDKIVRDIDLGSGHVVPAGFVTDWGSVPKFADNFFGIDKRRGSKEYLRHDFLYRTHLVPRFIADCWLWFDAKSFHPIERIIVFLTVLMFGGRGYRQKQP